MRGCINNFHLVINLPSNISANNLIDDLRIFSWEASEALLYYSQILKDSNSKSNIIENENSTIYHSSYRNALDFRIKNTEGRWTNESGSGKGWPAVGTINNIESAKSDSHYDKLLDHPYYAYPRKIFGSSVPDVLLSGHHLKIKSWQNSQREQVTKMKRPDLFDKFEKLIKNDK